MARQKLSQKRPWLSYARLIACYRFCQSFVGLPMSEITDGWEIISCRAKAPWHLFFMVWQMLLGNPDIAPTYSLATWTVRHSATGVIRKVTARSNKEAQEKIANGLFDED